jgi:oligopeptide/dipeptide ABC transporter ATP-binding protein
MYAGKIVEQAPAKRLFGAGGTVKMRYTRALLDAIPHLERPAHTELPVVSGRPPDPAALPPGCSFAPRCPHRFEDGTCDVAFPALAPISPTHRVACYLHTREQDEVRSQEPITIDPNSPVAEEVLGT